MVHAAASCLCGSLHVGRIGSCSPHPPFDTPTPVCLLPLACPGLSLLWGGWAGCEVWALACLQEATYIQEIMATADGQMVQHLVTTENQVSPPQVGSFGLWLPDPPDNLSPLSF